MFETVQSITADAIAAAIDAGYTGSTSELRAPLGRFEGEPWYLPYFYNAMLDGDGEPFGNGETTDCDVLDVDDNERQAFALEADTVAVAVTYSSQGFIGLVELNQARREQLEADYQTEDSDESELG